MRLSRGMRKQIIEERDYVFKLMSGEGIDQDMVRFE